MKVLSRDFTLKERLLLLFLGLILVALAYYQFVDKPARAALESARVESEQLTVELQGVQAKLDQMHRMRDELEDVTSGGVASEMGSYNNSKEEIASLNEILKDTLQYSITFANVTRSGDQIRRNFSLQFTVDNYESMERLLAALAENHHRCLIGEVRCNSTRNSNIMDGNITVNATATFFETMVGGTPDAGLPESRPSA